MEPVWREQGSKDDEAKLAQFHADGPEPARPVGEFGALLLADHLTAAPDEHSDCESAHALRQSVTVTSRYLKRWCLAGGGEADLASIRSHVASLVAKAKEQATRAATAARTAATAQQEAWAVADTTHVPRGRGLMYAQHVVPTAARASMMPCSRAARTSWTARAEPATPRTKADITC
ncbi:hypothetical protein [Streptomyces tamarix]|uniref:hypothetical protein n=1 Tax=Streptomyces tamarix TaxID=3078565 RepID=UPI003704BD8D